jgi:hypothetical protein
MSDIYRISSTDFRGMGFLSTRKMCRPSARDHLPRLCVCRGFRTPERKSTPPPGLPISQDRQSVLPCPGHDELLQAISEPRGGTPGTTTHSPAPESGAPHPIAWTPELLKNFEGCKASLSYATLLAQPDTTVPLALVTDASSSTVGAVLEQRVRNAWQPSPSSPRNLTRPSRSTAPTTVSYWSSMRP